MKIIDQGSIVIFKLNDTEYNWFISTFEVERWQITNKSIAVDHHFAYDIIDIAIEDGVFCE